MRLSEGGLSIVGPVTPSQGEPVRIRLLPHRKRRAIDVNGLVWNVSPARGAHRQPGFSMVGCLVSDPPEAFRALFSQIATRMPAPASRTIPLVSPRPSPPAEEVGADRDLPRVRELEAPPKRESEESLPTFRLRMKQKCGSRTRCVSVRALSLTEAEAIARSRIGGSAADWELIEVVVAS